jgi:cytoskeleton protein RodZ
VKHLEDIGNDFRTTRISSGINLEEVSSDTEIPVAALEQIEDGNIGSFKDIFELKEYLQTYAKYLGLDANAVIDEFNEYMFEYTSKIPLEDLEKAIAQKEKEEKEEETQEIKAVTPYLKPQGDNKITKIIIVVIIILILISITLVWAIKQVMIG